ncbi:hypothetical protein ACLOJK_029494 [Asimina triloba]
MPFCWGRFARWMLAGRGCCYSVEDAVRSRWPSAAASSDGDHCLKTLELDHWCLKMDRWGSCVLELMSSDPGGCVSAETLLPVLEWAMPRLIVAGQGCWDADLIWGWQRSGAEFEAAVADRFGDGSSDLGSRFGIAY